MTPSSVWGSSRAPASASSRRAGTSRRSTAAIPSSTSGGKARTRPGGFAGVTEMWDLKKPVIAALNGLAIGGGFEIALACDLIVAAEHVEFALPEMPLGIVPDAGAIQRLPRRIPYNIAMEMLLLGRRMPAAEAARYGLVNCVVPADQLMAPRAPGPTSSRRPRRSPCKRSRRCLAPSTVTASRTRLTPCAPATCPCTGRCSSPRTRRKGSAPS